MKTARMLTILVLVFVLAAASIAHGGQSLTVDNQPEDSIILKVGQTQTVEVVSDDSNPYNAYVGFDDGAVLGDFSHLQTMPAAGDLADVTEYNVPAFYGYYVEAAGVTPPPSPGVHFVFQYEGQQVGETDLKLYDQTLTSVTDSVHITVVPAEMGTAFTYQGHLYDANHVADGLYDFEFQLYDAPSDGNQVGGDVNKPEVDVIDGYFTVELDFDGGVFDGNGVWLEIGVRPGDLNDPNVYTTLSPRQRITPTPYAIYAQEAAYAQGAADLTLPYSGTVAYSGPAFSMTNTGTGYAGYFEQTGSSNTNGALDVSTAAGQYGAKILNQGGYGSSSWGLHVTSERDAGGIAYGIQSIANNNNWDAYGLQANATSLKEYAYGGYFRANAGGSYARGIYIDADNTKATSGGYSYGLQLYSDCANGQAYGIYSDVGVGSGSTSPLYGIYSYGFHGGTAGTSYGMWSQIYGSNGGDTYGIYSEGKKYSSDTAGTAYGGYFIGDNDRTGGESYGLYTKATGANGHRYGLYSEVTTSSGSYTNYGLKTKVANNNGNSYGLYADLEPKYSGYGVYVDLDTTTASTNTQCGLYSSVNHQGTGGFVYGVQSYTYSSDTGYNYAGRFSAYSNPGDTGYLYGIYAYCDNYTSGGKYAGYFYKSGGGNYAGYFSGNVHVSGTLTATSKPFIQPHKSDPSKEIMYASLEGPEHAVFIRGKASCENGVAVIKMPEYWQQVAADEQITVNLTPMGGWAGLYVESVSNTEVVVRVAEGGAENARFCYYITAPRDGFQEHQPIQQNTHFTADGTSASEFENRYTADTLDNKAIRAMLQSNGILTADGKLNMDMVSSLGWTVKANNEDSMQREEQESAYARK